MDFNIYYVDHNDKLLELLRKYDESFPESISSRVGSLEQYAAKLINFAQTYIISCLGAEAGIVSFYANDQKEKIAYLTMIAVAAEFRGKGIGSLLLQHCETKAKEAGMKYLQLEVDKRNKNAIEFYDNKGFDYYAEASTNTIYMKKEL